MTDLTRFYAAVRSNPFPGQIRQRQVEGVGTLVSAFERAGWPVAWAAYGLATAYHETAATMQPIYEIGKGNGKPYGKPDPLTGQTYYGRGFVQLTWLANYEKAQKELGFPLSSQPDFAMRTDIAAAIMIRGMSEGWFTGKKLSDYLNSPIPDYRNARRIINGTDKADLIAGYARVFAAALANADYGKTVVAAQQPAKVEDLPKSPDTPPATITSDEPIPKGFWARFLAAFRKRTSA